MRKFIATVCILLGVVCLLSAVGFVLYNNHENISAGQFSSDLLQQIKTQIKQNPDENNTDMPTISVLGYDSIGVLSIPVLQLELPILTDWDYQKLKKAPCLYYGNYHERDFVIAGHNYVTHFGKLSQLKEGDVITFTNVSGNTYSYEVVLVETLPKTATKEMLTSGFDLSLYTCTRGAQNRTTVRCIKK